MILKLNPSGQTCGSCGQVSNACEHHSAIIDIILCPPSSKIVSGSGFSSNAVGWRQSNHWCLEVGSVGQFEFISTIYSMAAKLKHCIYNPMSARSKCVLDLPLPVMRFHLKSWEKKEAMKNFDAAAAHKQAYS